MGRHRKFLYDEKLWVVKEKTGEAARDGGVIPLVYTTEKEAGEEAHFGENEQAVHARVTFEEIK